MSSQLAEQRRLSTEFARAHLQECAAEILDWRATALLRDGRLRELGVLCGLWCDDAYELQTAENLVVRVALEYVARGNGGTT